ncbi:MAG: S-adenosylmethionine decarboxylase [Phenylobacterium sp.]
MFYEGSEKKAEIMIDGDQLCLLKDFSDEFWTTMVEHCDAKILSQISNADCKAFLLSESSLFVWRDRLVIITCGQTRLVRAVEFFMAKVDHQLVLQLVYQRKNEYFANGQSSRFIDDVQVLNNQMTGIAWRFGELYGHHNYLYHLDNDYCADRERKTSELLAYQICESATAHLTSADVSADEIRQFLRLDELVPGFVLDDHVFSPCGYSLNAIKGQQYLTIHVTPQSVSSYISFESNFDLIEKIPLILSIIAPACFDLLCFNEHQFEHKITQHIGNSIGNSISNGSNEHYVSKALVREQLDNGLEVCFASYIRPPSDFGRPTRLGLSEGQPVF